jgi:murein DD-endopeptidase MepM/ murein hydrolase activator NlpD
VIPALLAFLISAPQSVNQGDVIPVPAPAPAASARLNGRTIRLFPAEAGGMTGLMPVPAIEKPGAYKLEALDASGKVIEELTVTVGDAHFLRQNISIDPKISALTPAPGDMDLVRAFQSLVSDKRLWAEPFAAPLPGCMTSPYGVLRLHNGKLTGGYHGGIDQRGAAGTPVRAIAPGIVRLARPLRVHGNAIGIDHGQGLQSMYLHLSGFAAKEGAQVAKGDIVGYVGSTGRSTGPHLHWSIYANGVPVNPKQWVKLNACAASAAKKKGKR